MLFEDIKVEGSCLAKETNFEAEKKIFNQNKNLAFQLWFMWDGSFPIVNALKLTFACF